MYSLVFLAIIGTAIAAPQAIIPYSMGMMPYTHITPYSAGVMPLYSTAMPYMGLAAKDMLMNTMMMPKPVEDTPEVKMAKQAFAVEYQKELMGMRHKRDLTTVMPFGVMPYGMMPHAYTSHIVRPAYTNTHFMTAF